MISLTDFFLEKGINEDLVLYIVLTVKLSVLIISCAIANYIVKKLVKGILAALEKHNKFSWNEALLNRAFYRKLAFLVPGIVLYLSAPIFGAAGEYMQRMVFIYISVISLFLITSVLDVLNHYYNTFPISNIRPIKGFIQIFKIVFFVIIIILIGSSIIGKSPLLMLSGLGAALAVFSFVFKDLILGLVAGIQLTSNDMLRIGDWIEVPKFDADGEVVELSLTTVKVQNFDKTFVTLPAYALVSDSFKNWRGMQESGGRRMKRSIYIDVNSIKFCTDDMVEKFKKFRLLKDYIDTKQKEIALYNEELEIDEDNNFNGRRLTNVGMFRAYIVNYIKAHPGINNKLTQIVRQLPAGEHGLPVEIYAFTSSTDWKIFEGAQSDIFDHLLAIASEFDLRIYQSPTGYDFKN
jgi:miniconductance mechanosensitive channel